MNVRKMQKFYVDVDQDGRVLKPTEPLDEEEDTALRDAICKSVTIWSILLPQMLNQLASDLTADFS
jgi:hypothetical protein